MTKADEGQEHELVLGNKHLLSGFFIVVVLLGVFFTMGYIVGRNAATATATTADASSGSPKSGDMPADRPSRGSSSGISSDAPGAGEPEANAFPPPNPPSPEVLTQRTKPFDDSPPSRVVPPESVPEAAAREATARVARPVEKPKVVEPKPVEKPKPVEQPSVATKDTGGAEGRKYLQVMAVKRPDAEKVLKILSGQGFPTTLRESSKEGLYRVLVGPYGDRPSLGKAKDDLKGAGFDAIVAH